MMSALRAGRHHADSTYREGIVDRLWMFQSMSIHNTQQTLLGLQEV